MEVQARAGPGVPFDGKTTFVLPAGESGRRFIVVDLCIYVNGHLAQGLALGDRVQGTMVLGSDGSNRWKATAATLAPSLPGERHRPAERTVGGKQAARAAGKQAASAAGDLAVAPGDSEEERLLAMALLATSVAAGDVPCIVEDETARKWARQLRGEGSASHASGNDFAKAKAPKSAKQPTTFEQASASKQPAAASKQAAAASKQPAAATKPPPASKQPVAARKEVAASGGAGGSAGSSGGADDVGGADGNVAASDAAVSVAERLHQYITSTHQRVGAPPAIPLAALQPFYSTLSRWGLSLVKQQGIRAFVARFPHRFELEGTPGANLHIVALPHRSPSSYPPQPPTQPPQPHQPAAAPPSPAREASAVRAMLEAAAVRRGLQAPPVSAPSAAPTVAPKALPAAPAASAVGQSAAATNGHATNGHAANGHAASGQVAGSGQVAAALELELRSVEGLAVLLKVPADAMRSHPTIHPPWPKCTTRPTNLQLMPHARGCPPPSRRPR